MLPRILVMGQLYWASDDCSELLDGVADVIHMQSTSRRELFKDLAVGGRYSDVVGIYHEHLSAKVVGHPDAAMINALPPSCKWFAHKGAGYDSVDVKAAAARGIGVSNTPGAVSEATATTAIYLILATMRRFSWCESTLRSGGFHPPSAIEASAGDLSGKTVGILGLGGIGLQIVDYLRPFGVKILYHNRKPYPGCPSDVDYCEQLSELLARLDILVVSIPLNQNTIGFIGEKEIMQMKKGSILINTARGPIVDEEAMVEALESGHLGSVGLDVFTTEPQVDKRLIAMPHITLLPHVGTETHDTRRKMEKVALSNLREFIVNGIGSTIVPECKEAFMKHGRSVA